MHRVMYHMTPSQSSLDTAEHTERNEAFEGADGGAPLVAILADEVSTVRVHTCGVLYCARECVEVYLC